MEIKEILKNKRKNKKITQEELSKILNMTRSAYAKYETGESTPPTDVLIKLADFYECSIDFLVGRYN